MSDQISILIASLTSRATRCSSATIPSGPELTWERAACFTRRSADGDVRAAEAARCIRSTRTPSPQQDRGELAMSMIVVQAFITLDGVVQAGGGPDEDPEGGFRHSGWATDYDAEFGGQDDEDLISEWERRTEALLL